MAHLRAPAEEVGSESSNDSDWESDYMPEAHEIDADDHEIVQQNNPIQDSTFMDRKYDSMFQFIRTARDFRDQEINAKLDAKHDRTIVEKADVDFVALPRGFQEMEVCVASVSLVDEYIRPKPAWMTDEFKQALNGIFNNVARMFALNVLLDITRIVSERDLDDVLCHMCALPASTQEKKVQEMQVCINANHAPAKYVMVFKDGFTRDVPDTAILKGLGPFLYFFWDAYKGISRLVHRDETNFHVTGNLDTFCYTIAPCTVLVSELIHKNLMYHLCYK